MSDILKIKDEQTFFTDAQINSLAEMMENPPLANHVAWGDFFHLCKQSGLDPWARQIYMMARWNNKRKCNTYSTQATIDGFRVVARRVCIQTGEVLSELATYWYDQDGNKYEEWVRDTPPVAAKYVIQRGQGQFSGFAKFKEYAGTYNNGELTNTWKKMPALMIAKCAEALALRKAFPQDLSGIYSAEEMAQAEPVEPIPTLEQRNQPAQETQEPSREAREPGSPEPVVFELPEMPKQGTEEDKTTQIDLVRRHAEILGLTAEQIQQGAEYYTQDSPQPGGWDTWPPRVIEVIWRAIRKACLDQGLVKEAE